MPFKRVRGWRFFLLKARLLRLDPDTTALSKSYLKLGLQIVCHSNRSPQLFELKKKQQYQVTLFKFFFVIFLLLHSCNAQYFHTTEHTNARLTVVVRVVDNELSSKCCWVGLITVTNTYQPLTVIIVTAPRNCLNWKRSNNIKSRYLKFSLWYS